MNDNALFQNILIFLKQGKFELQGEACLVFNDVFRAVQAKLAPPVSYNKEVKEVKEVKEPIKKPKKVKDVINPGQ